MPKPNFFIVGAPKCGTTAMYKYLKAHPDIFMPDRAKEPHFFDQEFQAPPMRQYQSRSDYLALFDAATDETRVGEASVFYLFSQQAAANIANFAPDAKIIAMLRNPVDMIYSLYYTEVYAGTEFLDSFEEALRVQDARKEGRLQPKNTVTVKKLLYTDIATYHDQLRRYYNHFGAANVHTIIFDDFAANTEAVYRDTLNFLGVATDFQPDFVRHNANKISRIQALRTFLYYPPDWYRTVQKIARQLIPQAARDEFNQLLFNFNTKSQPRPTMDPQLKKQLAADFKPEIDRLSDLLGRDLSHWYTDILD